VARFLEDVTSGAGDEEDLGGYDLQQFTLPAGADVTGKTVANLRTRLRAMKGPLLLAIAKPDAQGDYVVMPHPKDDILLDPGDSIVVLGNDEQNDRVASTLGVLQGR
jgi:Trk K+ transport system NAD-binding subunit